MGQYHVLYKNVLHRCIVLLKWLYFLIVYMYIDVRKNSDVITDLYN